jgi:NAD(P)H-dependent FMN reductase
MAFTSPKKVALIIASTRAIRVGPAVVDFVHRVLQSSPATPTPEISIIDVAKFNLPVFNERIVPSAPNHQSSNFEYEHSKAWSTAIASFDAYIWVSPEYNVGVPGGVKNAIDYLYHELVGKPVLIVTYGIFGGRKSSESLKDTFTGMKMRVAETRPKLSFAHSPERTDIMMAGVQGKLGPKTLELWEEEGKEPLLEGFGELVDLIKASVSEGAKAE